MGIEKRRAKRLAVKGVHGQLPFETKVEVLNLSLGGVAVRADRRLSAGTSCSIRLQVGELTLDFTGVVAWCTRTGFRKSNGKRTAVYAAGLKLDGVIPDKTRALLSFIDANKPSGEQRLLGIRFKIEAPATLKGLERYEVKRISVWGMLIETPNSLEVDSVHPMEIRPSRGRPIRLSGRVANQAEVERKAQVDYEVGIEFVKMSREDRSRLKRFVATLAR